MKGEALEKAIPFIRSWLEFHYKRLELPGFVVAIQYQDKVLFNEAYGYANLGTKAKMTPQHIFRIASHSKTFTSTAIMQLQEKGQLNLDDKVVKHIKWLKEHTDKRWQDVTIRQLLSHSAGVIRDGLDCDYWAIQRPFPDKAEFRRELLKADLVYDSNKTMKYSNYGFTLLGEVIDTVSGLPYNDYVTRNIIKPLGLKNTGPEYISSIKDKVATGYSRGDLEKKRLPLSNVDTKAMSSATGFYSTAEDLCKYTLAHYAGNTQILSEDSKKEIHRKHWKVANTKEREEYGLGFTIDYADRHKLIGHGGGFPGYITKTIFDPRKKYTIVVLTNAIDGEAKTIAVGIDKVIQWFQTNYSDHPKHDFKAFEGRFMNLWAINDIISSGNKIVAVSPDTWEPFKEHEELEYIDATTLKIAKANGYSSEGELIHFELAGNKTASSIVYAGSKMVPEAQYLKDYGKQDERRA